MHPKANQRAIDREKKNFLKLLNVHCNVWKFDFMKTSVLNMK